MRTKTTKRKETAGKKQRNQQKTLRQKLTIIKTRKPRKMMVLLKQTVTTRTSLMTQTLTTRPVKQNRMNTLSRTKMKAKNPNTT